MSKISLNEPKSATPPPAPTPAPVIHPRLAQLQQQVKELSDAITILNGNIVCRLSFVEPIFSFAASQQSSTHLQSQQRTDQKGLEKLLNQTKRSADREVSRLDEDLQKRTKQLDDRRRDLERLRAHEADCAFVCVALPPLCADADRLQLATTGDRLRRRLAPAVPE